jgi:hypothetical protein
MSPRNEAPGNWVSEPKRIFSRIQTSSDMTKEKKIYVQHAGENVPARSGTFETHRKYMVYFESSAFDQCRRRRSDGYAGK